MKKNLFLVIGLMTVLMLSSFASAQVTEHDDNVWLQPWYLIWNAIMNLQDQITDLQGSWEDALENLQEQIEALTGTHEEDIEDLQEQINTLEERVAALEGACTPEPEVCDGIDNDCDDLIDEDFPDKDTICYAGLGVCRSSGNMVCNAAQDGTECDAVPGMPTETPEASCNDGLDNDCDGLTDGDDSDCAECSVHADCDDGNVCTIDTCDAGTCNYANNANSCDDGNECTTSDTCSGGTCVGGPPPNCDDSESCTTDSCDSLSGCINEPVADGTSCSGGQCVGGECVPTAFCGDGNVDPGEECDDGSTTDGDGCSASCTVEPGWTCEGEPSTCSVAYTIDYCSLAYPMSISTGPSTDTSVYGRLYIAGLTDLTTGNDPAPAVIGEVGHGADGSDPSSNPGSWTWFNTIPSAGWSDPYDDEYVGTLTSPAAAGTYDYVYRFSGDNGATWVYCDYTGDLGVTAGADADGDGWTIIEGDCDDSDETINPGVVDIPGNDIDENCDDTVACYNDVDNDGYGTTTSSESTFTATGGAADTSGACGSNNVDSWDDTNDDCDDNDYDVHPGAPEQCNGADEDCDGEIDEDNPGGGVPCDTGLPGVCAAGTLNCRDAELWCESNTSASPEVCDGLDNDCDGLVDDGNLCPPTANVLSTSCVSAQCDISSCYSNYGDIDGIYSNGCECSPDVYELNNVCSSPYSVGTLTDEGESTTVTGRLSYVGDVDYYKFYAEDTTDLIPPDDFYVRIRFTSNPIDEFRLDVSTSESCSTWDVTDATDVYDDGSYGPDDSSWYVVRVHRKSGATPTCNSYTLEMSNGVYG